MSDKVFLGARVSQLDAGTCAPVSRVNLLVDSQHRYTAGDNAGRTVEAACPWGTQAMAERILERLRGVDYRPYSGLDGLLDPAAEVGDGITVGGVYSVLAQTDILFDRHCTADVSAPGGDEAEDEYPYRSQSRRQAERDLARLYSSITKTSERITFLVANEVEGLEGKIELTSTSLSTRITNVQSGLESRITQTASSLASEIENARDGLNSKIEQTAGSFSTQIQNANEEISSLRQTATSLQSQIRNANNDISSISQTVDSISLDVSNGSEYSTISLYRNGIRIESHDIEFTGMVTFRSLSEEGESTINGGNITTGQIDAGRVGVTGEFAVYNRWGVCGYMGAGEGDDGNGSTYGAKLSSANGRNYLLAANSGVRMKDSYGAAIWVTGGNCFSSSDMQTYSDRRLKTDIDYDLECYKAFFRALKPCRFLMLGNPARGYHTGFIAQDVQAAMEAANLSQMDFAGLADAKLPDGSWGLSLSYGSFAALNAYMIQDLEKRVEKLERRLHEGTDHEN